MFEFISSKTLIRKIIHYASKHDYNLAQKVGVQVWGYGENEIFDKEVFLGYEQLIFEGKPYKVPKDYVAYLSNLYGDFMSLPPLNKRMSHHDFKVYYK